MKWKIRAGISLALSALSACVGKPSVSTQPPELVDLCELYARPSPYLGKIITTRASLVGTAGHGIFARMPECPEIYQDVSMAQDAKSDVFQTYALIEGVLVEPSDQIYTLTGKPEFRRVPLSGTAKSSNELILFLTDIDPKRTSK